MAPFVYLSAPGLSDNAGMAPRTLHLAGISLLFSACGMTPQPVVTDPVATATSTGLEFRGERPCVDCDGIGSWLRLEHDGKRQRYRMVEEYFGAEDPRRFEDEGDWIARNDLLRLRSREGGERVYARLADGRLQARGAHGQPLPAAADDVMTPVTFDSAH